MTKKELFTEIEKLNLDRDSLIHAMFDWFEGHEIEGFIDFLHDEFD